MLIEKETNKALFPLLEIIYELYKKDLKDGKIDIGKYEKPIGSSQNLKFKFDEVFSK
jgi:hypothetical protein